jgi:hypothetical protein
VNWNHKARKILITGKSGSGKTTLWLDLLKRWPAHYRFIYDADREVSRKCRWRASATVAELKAQLLARQPVVFDPARMFAADFEAGFAFFCRWLLNVSRCLNGPKVFAVDEVWRYAPSGSGLPPAFQEILNVGRREEIDLLFIAQRANKVHDGIRAQLTEIITFQHSDRLPLEWLAEDFDPDAVKALKYPGGYLKRSLIGEQQPSQTHPTRKGNRPKLARR